MRRSMVIVVGGCVAAGAFALAQPERAGERADPALNNATVVERAILERLERIERGVFRENSTLPRSANDSLEERLERMMGEVRGADEGDRAPGLDNDDARLRDLDREFREFEMEVARKLERPAEELSRRVADVEREVDRIEMDRGAEREIESLRRSIGRIERQIASIERRIR